MLKRKYPKTFIAVFILIAIICMAAFSFKVPRETSGNKEKSLQAFNTILKVIKSPRCINCHPTGDIPHQGDDQHVHLFNVSRGIDNYGGPVQKCSTCHHNENMPYSNVPGAPKWALAPKSMGWFGLSDLQLGQALIDKTKNGGRDAKALVEHMGYDSLVLWAWNPGAGRNPPPLPIDEFRKVLNEWLVTGAYVLEKEK